MKLYIILIGAAILFTASTWVTYRVFESNQEQLELNDSLRSEAPGDFIALSQGLTHYQLSGDSTAELMLFIHGGGITGMEIWKQNISHFANQGYQTLSYDLYGRGYSDRPDVEQNPLLFRDQLIGLLDSLHITKPISVVSLSMGAMVALDLAGARPGLVKKIVLIDPIASGSFKPSTLLTFPLFSKFILTTYWYPRAVKKQKKEFVNQELFDQYAQRLTYFMNIEGYKQTNLSTWRHMLTQDKLNILKGINPKNVLIIYGDKDPYFGYGQRHQYLSNFPMIKMIQIDSTGHMPQYENPWKVNKIMENFIADS